MKESKAQTKGKLFSLKCIYKTIPAIINKDSRQQEVESSIVIMLREIKSLPFTNADFTSRILEPSLLLVMVMKIMALCIRNVILEIMVS